MGQGRFQGATGLQVAIQLKWVAVGCSGLQVFYKSHQGSLPEPGAASRAQAAATRLQWVAVGCKWVAVRAICHFQGQWPLPGPLPVALPGCKSNHLFLGNL